MGTPEFSLPGLRALIAEKDFEIVGVFTQADKPVGREQAITPPPVKILALENNLPIFNQKNKKSPRTIKKLLRFNCGNCLWENNPSKHFRCSNMAALMFTSLLPKYHGALV